MSDILLSYELTYYKSTTSYSCHSLEDYSKSTLEARCASTMMKKKRWST